MVKHSYETLAVQTDMLRPSVFGSSRVGYDLLRVAHENGGFIAGGFARKIVMLSQNSALDVRDKAHHLRQYLGNTNNSVWVSRGDIDLFFFDHRGREKTLQWALDNAAGTPPILITDSLTGNAKTLKIEGVQFQLINIVVGRPEQVVDTFDICNAMVAVRGGRALQLVGRSGLDEEGLVEVDNWNTPYTVCRVAKYLRRMKNEREGDDAVCGPKAPKAVLHPRTAGELMDVAHDLVVKLKKEPISYPNDDKVRFTENNVIGSLKCLVPWLPSGDLVLLAAYFAREKKNIAVEELLKRGHAPKLLVANWSRY